MNEQAFNELVHQHRDKIYRLCRGYLYDQSLADDLYQEVLINLWHSLEKFRGASALSTWIYRVTVNTAITFNRKSKRQPQKAEISPTLSDDGELQKEAILEKEQKLNRLHYCISQLPKEERLIITLVLEDVSYKEIAEVMGISVNYTGVKIKRIKERLGKMMANAITQKS